MDTVTNNRPGIVLKKTDFAGNPLAGVTFTLKDGETLIGTFTSDDTGLVTVAFLSDNKNYTLTETSTPQGYRGLQQPMTIRLRNRKVTVTGAESVDYTIDSTGTPTVTIKNRPMTFKAVKKSASDDQPLAGVKFALHKQHTVSGSTSFDTEPMPGYENLVTDENGVIPEINETLPPGTYQLREIKGLDGYEQLDSYVHFTVTDTGAIVMGTKPDAASLTESAAAGEDAANGTYQYLLTITNTPFKKVSFKKVANENTDTILPGAHFDLYKIEGNNETMVQLDLVSGEDGILAKNGTKVFNLSTGTYHLIETIAPAGYNMKESPVVINVTQDDITYDEGTTLSASGDGKSYDKATMTYTLKISNSPGVELPHTGGIGTTVFYILGTLLLGGSAIMLIARRRLRRS